MSTPSSNGARGSVSPPRCDFSSAVIILPSAISTCTVRVFFGPGIQFRTIGSAGFVMSRTLHPRSSCAPAYMYQRPFA